MVDGACWRCRYFSHLDPDDTISDETGECRRFPPIPMDDGDGNVYAQYPPTGWTEWCGEFAKDTEENI